MRDYPRPKKSLGQNFLLDADVLRRIVEQVPADLPDALAIEIGTGTGSLTELLAKRFKKVVTVEIDDRLVEWHRERELLPENCRLIHKDILRISLPCLIKEEGEQDAVIFGNLPYNIASQIVFKLCSQPEVVREAYLLFQREVAQRIVSKPGGKSYGVLSVIAQHYFDVELVMNLPPNLFHPRPKVYSSLVVFKRREEGGFAKDYQTFKRTVKAAFSQRRKKLINSLRSVLAIPREELEEILHDTGLRPDMRAEQVDLNGFIALSNNILKYSRNTKGMHV